MFTENRSFQYHIIKQICVYKTMDALYDEHNRLTDNEMKSVYEHISVSIDVNFDLTELTNIIYNSIEETFGESFVKSENTNELLQNKVFINEKFTQYLKYLISKDIKKLTRYDVSVGIMFVIFCDYFNIDYNKSFLLLHPNIQDKIKKSLIKMIGSKEYKKYENIIKKEQGLDGMVIRKLI